ncbi:Octaprenyl diphosphate synthase [Alkalibacterium sp. AK22]|uniref:polyprenyl synthetase family protein n=1 Tax=Alkalibacterium sp. AK22 TaxID=1229520 RepID=UPI000448C16A|nr:farnesyl diphosphate synthase [Alkalibacterium sp. AK22]EXJ22765.1 Octaprenyl diphosphate synthase [Alkalibacterium sp. AK22]
MKFIDFSKTHKQPFEAFMLGTIKEDSGTQLEEAMRYSLKAGGKRLRPLILFAVAKAFGQKVESIYAFGAALEMIHTYSLIHDDLPAMDDDDLRRGIPTSHIQFSEATAILAGDALLTKAFELVTEGEASDEVKVKLVRLLAEDSGHAGMVGGQQADMNGEHKQLTVEELESIHARKTGRLIHFAFYAGGLLSGVQTETLIDLKEMALALGIAYQIKDDILDVEGDEKELGKRTGADAKLGKSTYPGLLGISEAHRWFKDKLDLALTLNQQIAERETTYDQELLASFVESFQFAE